MTLSQLAGKAQAPLALAGVGAILAAMFFGWPKVGQLAWADDTNQQIEQKVASTISPVTKQLSELADSNTELLLELTQQKLLENNRRRCAATTAGERDYWQGEINKLKPKYLKYSGTPYDQQACGEL